MKVDLDHLHHWMRAIRSSNDPMRTMDAFWKGQLSSKEWLVDTVEYIIDPQRNKIINFPVTIDIYGGWVGTLSSLFFQSQIPIKSIRSIDIDPNCEDVACNMNQIELEQGRFRAITADMCNTSSTADIVVNTSCEHVTQEQYMSWLIGIPKTSLLVLQSNNYKIPEHVRIAKDLKDFETQCGINIVWSGQLETALYTRYMVIGNV
jgi:hypothetical protein